MVFSYSEFFIDRFNTGLFDYKVYRPLLDIVLKNGSNSIPTTALVDSGADRCTFPTTMGEAIGLDVHSVTPEVTKGINNINTNIYVHDVLIIVRNNRLHVKCGFVDELGIPLLGQEGFFDQYLIKFHHHKKQFELIPNHRVP